MRICQVIDMSRCLEILLLFHLFISFDVINHGECVEGSRSGAFEIFLTESDIPNESFIQDVLGSRQAASQIACSLSCLHVRGCATALYKMHGQICTILRRYLKAAYKVGVSQKEEKMAKVFVMHLKEPCKYNPCSQRRQCTNVRRGYRCICAIDEIGHLCETKMTGKSCLAIKQKYSSFKPKNGKYTISDPQSHQSFLAYCDMEFDGGGWTQIANIQNKKGGNSIRFHEISTLADFPTDQNYLATSPFLSTFRKLADFKQFRFECNSAITKRKIHIKTKRSMMSVVDYLVGKTRDQPTACGSFTTYEDDSSEISKKCQAWGYDKNVWGDGNYNTRLADHPMYVRGTNHWVLRKDRSRFECDNYGISSTAGDFWYVYVR